MTAAKAAKVAEVGADDDAQQLLQPSIANAIDAMLRRTTKGDEQEPPLPLL